MERWLGPWLNYNARSRLPALDILAHQSDYGRMLETLRIFSSAGRGSFRLAVRLSRFRAQAIQPVHRLTDFSTFAHGERTANPSCSPGQPQRLVSLCSRGISTRSARNLPEGEASAILLTAHQVLFLRHGHQTTGMPAREVRWRCPRRHAAKLAEALSNPPTLAEQTLSPLPSVPLAFPSAIPMSRHRPPPNRAA